MRRLLVGLALVVSGCATIAGPQGAYEGTIDCKGKGTVTLTGRLTTSITGDCGEGFTYTHRRERTAPVELPARP